MKTNSEKYLNCDSGGPRPRLIDVSFVDSLWKHIHSSKTWGQDLNGGLVANRIKIMELRNLCSHRKTIEVFTGRTLGTG